MDQSHKLSFLSFLSSTLGTALSRPSVGLNPFHVMKVIALAMLSSLADTVHITTVHIVDLISQMTIRTGDMDLFRKMRFWLAFIAHYQENKHGD